MRSSLRRWCAPLGCALSLFSVLLSACNQHVREDRTIPWASDGKTVGFQHGKDGIFVADREGGMLRKIFQPGDDVLATSAPQWAPDGKRAIFTTARAASPQSGDERRRAGVDNPAGN